MSAADPGEQRRRTRQALLQMTAEERAERYRSSLEAIRNNLTHWPATMTRERLLEDLNAALDGFLLETLT